MPVWLLREIARELLCFSQYLLMCCHAAATVVSQVFTVFLMAVFSCHCAVVTVFSVAGFVFSGRCAGVSVFNDCFL